MKKVVLAAINAKFIHSSLAVWSLYGYSGKYQRDITVKEFTINHTDGYILREIFMEKPAVLCFSCYIWNIELIKRLLPEIRKVLPGIVIVLGGPEVSYDLCSFSEYGGDVIVPGEGEIPFLNLLAAIEQGRGFETVPGVVYKTIYNEPDAEMAAPLDSIPFPYSGGVERFENKILYYESSRGCPFACQYCLSSVEKGVRFRSLDLVYTDLKFFIERRVRQVKFVDRTFNCNKKHAMGIWAYLIAQDQGATNFHFEISADLLDHEMLDLLATARKGLFQLEIGVQSTNTKTLAVIKRKTELGRLFDKVRRIKAMGNIHQHLDLIAGLPGEDMDSFRESFNQVYALQPEMLQLGFLKLLKGSGLRKDSQNLGLVFNHTAPYEILYTNELCFEDILTLKSIEEMVEIYYNSGRFKYSLSYLTRRFGDGFSLFQAMARYWEAHGYHHMSHSKMALYTILHEFYCVRYKENQDFFRDLLKFDILIDENTKNLPAWAGITDYSKIKAKCSRFYEQAQQSSYFNGLLNYSPKQRSKMCHIEAFDYNILKWAETARICKKTTYVFFNYYDCKKNYGRCSCFNIAL